MVHDYTDADLIFYLVVYKDFDRATWCLTNVRRHYPNARIVIDVDGDDDPRWADLRELFNAEVYYGERLFLVQHGVKLVKRAFMRHVEDPEHRRWMFRIDTDTEIRRRFRYLPDHDYFGQYDDWRNFIQGGCIGLSLRLSRLVIDNGCLDLSWMGNVQKWPRSLRGYVWGRMKDHGIISFDWVLNWAVTYCGIKAHDFSEVRSQWRKAIPKTVDCAVAHPCKHIRVNRPV